MQRAVAAGRLATAEQARHLQHAVGHVTHDEDDDDDDHHHRDVRLLAAGGARASADDLDARARHGPQLADERDVEDDDDDKRQEEDERRVERVRVHLAERRVLADRRRLEAVLARPVPLHHRDRILPEARRVVRDAEQRHDQHLQLGAVERADGGGAERPTDGDEAVDGEQDRHPDGGRLRHVAERVRVLDDVRDGGALPRAAARAGARQQRRRPVDERHDAERDDQHEAVGHRQRLEQERRHLVGLVALQHHDRRHVADHAQHAHAADHHRVEDEAVPRAVERALRRRLDARVSGSSATRVRLIGGGGGGIHRRRSLASLCRNNSLSVASDARLAFTSIHVYTPTPLRRRYPASPIRRHLPSPRRP